MEHPVPQNVTSFEFHLIGDMTLKQFGYLASGLAIAYLTFVFLLDPYPYLAAPVIALSALTGAAFAFLPIADRPLDHWMGAYLKAVFSQTKGLWRPQNFKGKVAPSDPVFKSRLQLYLLQAAQTATAPTVQPTLKPPAGENTPKEILPSDEQLRATVELAKQAQIIQTKIIEAQQHINQLKTMASATDPKTVNLQALINQAQQLAAQISQVTGSDGLRQAPAPPRPAIPGPLPASPASGQDGPAPIKPGPPPQKAANQNPVVKPEVKVVEAPKQPTTQLVLTSLPNVINGVVTDSAGNYLESVVVVIHNQDNLPVRASKTNKLGQFTGATPLPSGTYTVTLEKDNLSFDVLQVTLKGEVLAPLLIQAKKVV